MPDHGIGSLKRVYVNPADDPIQTAGQ